MKADMQDSYQNIFGINSEFKSWDGFEDAHEFMNNNYENIIEECMCDRYALMSVLDEIYHDNDEKLLFLAESITVCIMNGILLSAFRKNKDIILTFDIRVWFLLEAFENYCARNKNKDLYEKIKKCISECRKCYDKKILSEFLVSFKMLEERINNIGGYRSNIDELVQKIIHTSMY